MARDRSVGHGRLLVVGLLLLGVTAAVGAIWFQRHQTRRCLAFYGPIAARRITSAAGVDLLGVQPGGGPRRLAASTRVDVSKAPGLVHLRRGLVEDANFTWDAARVEAGVEPPVERAMRGGRQGDGPSRPLDCWDAALVFTDRDGGQTTLVVDLDPHAGALAVVGQPGWIGLGRIGRGLDTWIRDTMRRRSDAE